MTLEEIRALLKSQSERRTAIASELHQLLELSQKETRQLSEDEVKTWETLEAEDDGLAASVRRLEGQERRTREQAAPVKASQRPTPQLAREAPIHSRSDERWSLFNVVAASYEHNPDLARHERRISDEMAEVLGKRPRGYYVPPYGLMPIKRQVAHEREQRNITAGTTGAGLIETELIQEEFIEILRNESKVAMAGARMLSGLVGNVNLPSQTGAATATWLTTEVVTAPVDTTQDFSSTVDLAPKTVAVKAEITRRMLLQSTPGIEDLVREDVRQVIGIEIDAAALVGTGTTQPLGITDTSRSTGAVSVGATPATTITWGNVVALETAVGTANALRGSLAYMANHSITGGLKTSLISSESGRFIAEVTNPMGAVARGLTINGYPLHVTEQIPATTATDEPALVFGNFASILIGMWGALDLFADPYTLGDAGGMVIRGFQDVDVQIRHEAAFAVGRQSA